MQPDWTLVPAGCDPEPVRRFGTFTPDLQALVKWLVRCGVDTVAMESTGVYWVPIFELLEAQGLKAYLVNARHIKNVPGRKSDYLDCQWIQKLHTLGFLAASFRPEADICRLRAYLRHRAKLLQQCAPHILQMQKALQQMNIQLPQVLTDITGTTGLAILRSIVAGERDAVKLAQLRNPACKSSEEMIAKALTGDWKEEQLFILKQALELYDFYTQQVVACDTQIQQQFSTIKPRWEASPLPSSAPSPASFPRRASLVFLNATLRLRCPHMNRVIHAECCSQYSVWYAVSVGLCAVPPHSKVPQVKNNLPLCYSPK